MERRGSRQYAKIAAIVIVAFVLIVAAPILVMQSVIAPIFHAVDGSFGLQPVTHGCIGLLVKPESVSFLPQGKVETDFLIHLRYDVLPQNADRDYCLGQDVWFGE